MLFLGLLLKSKSDNLDIDICFSWDNGGIAQILSGRVDRLLWDEGSGDTWVAIYSCEAINSDCNVVYCLNSLQSQQKLCYFLTHSICK